MAKKVKGKKRLAKGKKGIEQEKKDKSKKSVEADAYADRAKGRVEVEGDWNQFKVQKAQFKGKFTRYKNQ